MSSAARGGNSRFTPHESSGSYGQLVTRAAALTASREQRLLRATSKSHESSGSCLTRAAALTGSLLSQREQRLFHPTRAAALTPYESSGSSGQFVVALSCRRCASTRGQLCTWATYLDISTRRARSRFACERASNCTQGAPTYAISRAALNLGNVSQPPCAGRASVSPR